MRRRNIKNIQILAVALISLAIVSAGKAEEGKNTFTIVKEIKHLPVTNQGSTSTCWSFATASFLESEIIRKGLPEADLSEMFFVKHAYKNKVEKYILYHGNNNFGEGGLAHDVLNVVREHGVVSYDAYPGVKINGKYRHDELFRELKQGVNELNKMSLGLDPVKMEKFNSILENHIGKTPGQKDSKHGFTDPVKYRERLDIDPDDYVELSSFTHHPFYESFVLEIPDNWSHDLYYNLPVDELMEVIDHALNAGFSVCWDGDISESYFSDENGIAALPKNLNGKADQEMRQKTFLNRTTTDDHLMHIIGISKDEDGKRYYYTKNSWGKGSNSLGGYLHMSEGYVRLKTIAIMVHKESIPGHIRAKLDL